MKNLSETLISSILITFNAITTSAVQKEKDKNIYLNSPEKIMTIEIEKIIDIAHNAGTAIMEIYNQAPEKLKIVTKDDNSPLTAADTASNKIISQALTKFYPEIPILSEESRKIEYAKRKNWQKFWLIDPLDGTKEFIKRNGEFTVNIALLENNIPTLGVVYAPTKDLTYFCAGKGKASFVRRGSSKNDEKLHPKKHYSELQKIRVVASRSHMSEQVKKIIANLEKSGKEVELAVSGSSLKICMVAEGLADVYPRFAPTSEWDTAAAHAIATGAGRNIYQYEKVEGVEKLSKLRYNKENLLNPWFIVE